MGMALACPRCGLRRAVAKRRADFGIACAACHEFLDVERTRPPGQGRGPTSGHDRPWTPWQIVGASLLFGVGAGGAVAGFNFARLGKWQYRAPCVLAGAVAFVLAAGAVIFLVPGEAVRLVGLLANLAGGVGFMLVQKPFFDAWKAGNWRPNLGDRYRPNGLGQLLVVCLVSLAAEIGVVGLLAFLGGIW
jgi:hypothetical protein